MRRAAPPFLASLVVAIILTLAPPVAADDAAAANRLFVSGLNAWNQAEALTGDDPATAERRVALLEQVVGDLRRIVDDHAGADLAVRLAIGEQVGPLSLPAAAAALEEARIALSITTCSSAPTRACIEIAAAQAEAGYINAALAAARSIGEAGVRASAFGVIAAAQARAGQTDAARETLDAALATARSIADARQRAQALQNIAEAMVVAPVELDQDVDGTRQPDFRVGISSAQLTATERDALRRRVERCWRPPEGLPDAENLVVQVRVSLTVSGEVRDIVVVDAARMSRDRAYATAVERAMGAIRQCAPYNLPRASYANWQSLLINFDPR